MRRILLVAMAAVVVIGGLVVARLSAGHSSADQPQRDAHVERAVFGTREAASTAAISFATAPQEWLHETDDAIRADIANIAAPGARPGLEAAALREISTARASLKASPGPVWWLVRPLAWRVDSYTEDRAEVSLWMVRILSAVEVAAPQSAYVTVTVTLEWHDGHWRLAAMTEAAGPTPSGATPDQVADSASFDQALRGFTRVGTEA